MMGGALEYYEFMVFGFMAPTLGRRGLSPVFITVTGEHPGLDGMTAFNDGGQVQVWKNPQRVLEFEPRI